MFLTIKKTMASSLSDEEIVNVTEEIVHESGTNTTEYIKFDGFEGDYTKLIFTIHAPNYH